MRIDSAGNVGIGTSSPDTALHLASTSPVLRFENPTTTSTTGTSMGKIEWETRDASAPGVIGYIDVVDSNSFGTAFDMQLATGVSGAATTKVTIKADGNVGIGTSSPLRTLHVAGAGDTGLMLQTTNAVNDKEIWEIQAAGDASNHANLVFRSRTNAGTGGTEALRITNDGKVGIGTTDPVRPLHVNSGVTDTVAKFESSDVAAIINFVDSGDANGVSLGVNSGNMIFRSGLSSERMRIDTSGRLLVGTSSALNVFGIQVPLFQVYGTSSNNRGRISIAYNNAESIGPGIHFNKSPGTLDDLVSNNDVLGALFFEGGDGSAQVRGASIEAQVDGTPGANDMPGRLVFSTTADGASSPTERFRIASTGRATLDLNNAGFYLLGLGSAAGTNALRWSSSTGLVTADTSSRLVKENIVDCPYGIDTIKALQPRKYFRTDDQRNEIGFVADEMTSVLPELVPYGPKSVITNDPDDTENIPIGVNYEKLTAVLTKALQEAITKIETLEARLTAAGIE
jgi:hypothetical protein